jgi:hypothetical protein
LNDDIIKSSGITEKIRLNIQQSLINLIPTEKWDSLIQGEISDFVKTRLPNLIRIEVERKFQAVIKEFLLGPEFQSKFDQQGKEMASDAVKTMLVEMSPQILSALFGDAMQQAIDSLKYNLQNYR